jgi:hypothetical protein
MLGEWRAGRGLLSAAATIGGDGGSSPVRNSGNCDTVFINRNNLL